MGRTVGVLLLSGFVLGTSVARPHALKQVDQKTTPCPGQSTSLAELQTAFSRGSLPTPTQMTETWVGIGFFGTMPETRILTCAGIFREEEGTFEEVISAQGYSIIAHIVGTVVQGSTVAVSNSALTFPFDFGGDSHPVFRCRLTQRKTLACLIDVYRQGIEFKQISVR